MLARSKPIVKRIIEEQKVIEMLRQPEVIGIASGKGGVGKTSLSVNIARQMAENGKKVFLFDGDMGLANAQIALGVKARENISHVILGEKNINEIVIQVSQGVSLIPGARTDHANMTGVLLVMALHSPAGFRYLQHTRV